MTVSKPFPVYDPLSAFADRLRDKLVAEGILTADRVTYGSGLAFRQEDAPHVYVDLAPSAVAARPSAGATNTGFGIRQQMKDDDDDDVDVETRSLWTCLDGILITILGQVPESGEEADDLRGDEPAILARLSVFQLRARVLAAVYHILHIGPTATIPMTWVRPDEQEFQYGAAIQLTITLGTEVPDEPLILAKPSGEVTVIAGMPSGNVPVAVLTLVQPSP
jgi:hypothetical protein